MERLRAALHSAAASPDMTRYVRGKLLISSPPIPSRLLGGGDTSRPETVDLLRDVATRFECC